MVQTANYWSFLRAVFNLFFSFLVLGTLSRKKDSLKGSLRVCWINKGSSEKHLSDRGISFSLYGSIKVSLEGQSENA